MGTGHQDSRAESVTVSCGSRLPEGVLPAEESDADAREGEIIGLQILVFNF